MARTLVLFTDSSAFGGAEVVLLTLLAGLDRERWRPVLMHHTDGAIESLLDGARGLGVELRAVPRLAEGSEGPKRLPAFVRTLRAERPDVFNAHLSSPMACKYGLLGAALARVRAVIATEHLYLDLPWSASDRLKHRIVAAGVDRYIAVSHHLARRLQEAFDLPAHKLRIVHNGIDIERFARPVNPGLRTSLADDPPRPVVLTTGRLDQQKGHHFLLEAAARVPEVRFVLAGDGPERAALEAQALALGLGDRVHFLGRRIDVPDLLAACDIFVLPSLFEGLPLSVLEAMAAGKPVITSAIGGTDEAVLDGESGILVPPGEPSALTAALRRVLADGALATRLGEAGRQRVRSYFSETRMVESVMRVYDEVLDGRR